MREIRDEINREIAGMSPEEEQRWFAEQRAKLERSAPAPNATSRVDPREVFRRGD
jgi:hypothetical protein